MAGYKYTGYGHSRPQSSKYVPEGNYGVSAEEMAFSGAGQGIGLGKAYMNRTTPKYITPQGPTPSGAPMSPELAPDIAKTGAATKLGAGTSIASAGIGGYGAGKFGEAVVKKAGGNKEISTGAGLATSAGAGFAIGGPYGAAAAAGLFTASKLSKRTWLCTAANESVGLNDDKVDAMTRLRAYGVKKHSREFDFYIRNGEQLIHQINKEKKTKENINKFYEEFKEAVIEPVVKLIEDKELEQAYQFYAKKTRELFKKYVPDLSLEGI
jgi:gas vesicle protein